jgi:transcriptional regulator with XRE-family HTH domain
MNEEAIANGRRLRAMRALLGLRQEDVAQRARCTRKTVSRAEAGERVQPVMRRAIEEALGIANTPPRSEPKP